MDRGRVIAARFEIQEMAGAGGMGTVYRAHDRVTQAPVALKILSPQGDARRFAKEAEVLQQVEHPHIVQYVAHGLTEHDPSADAAEQDAPLAYLAMEWIEGEDLRAHLDAHAMDEAQTIRLGSLLANALGAIHRAGFVHRDLKPTNVRLGRALVDNAKVLDFGVTRSLDVDWALTRTGVIIGTAAYMAPEAARDGGAVDARADVYSLGCLLFECIAKRPPFVGAHPIAVLAKTLIEPAPRLASLRPEVSSGLDELLARMLSKEPADRPRDGDEVAELLRAASDEPCSAAPSTRSAITDLEQRVVGLLLTGPLPPDPAFAAAAQNHDDHRAPTERAPTVHRLANGSLLARFSGGASPADDAVRAARYAQRIQRLAPEVPIALVTGRAVLAHALPMGRAVDQATELLQQPQGVSIRFDSDTRALLETSYELSYHRRLLQLTPRSPLHTKKHLLGRPVPCLGRERELALLRSTHAEVEREPVSRAVLVTAPAGVGKSRLVAEFLGDPALWSRPAVILFGGATSSGAFQLAGQLVRRAAGLSQVDEPGGREFLKRYFHSRLAADVGPAVGEFLAEIAFPDQADAPSSAALRAARNDASLMQDALQMAFVDWLAAETRHRTVVLVLEDVHWADRPSLRLVDAALRSLRERPLFVIGTARPEVHELYPELWREREVQEIRLGMLTRRASEHIVFQALGETVSRETIAQLATRAGGHPFFLEELIRAVADGAEASTLPDTVLGMLQSRLDALGLDARHVLRAASIFGEAFTADGVAALLGPQATDVKLHAALVRLEAGEIIERRRGAPAGSYSFRHALVRDAAYAMLTDDDLRTGHRRAARYLSRSPALDALRLAEHFERGGEPDQAAPYLQRAAEQALRGTDPERVFELAKRIEQAGTDESTRGGVSLLLAEAHYWAGDLHTSAACSERALATTPRGSAAWYAALGLALTVAGQKGDNAGVRAWLATAASTHPASDGLNAQTLTVARGVCQLIWAHRASSIPDAIARLQEIAQSPDDLDPYARGYLERIQGELCFVAGELERSFAALQRAMAAFERAGAVRMMVHIGLTRAALMASAADAYQSAAEMDRAVAQAERLGSPYLLAYARLTRGIELLLRDLPAAAIPHLAAGGAGVQGSGRLAFLGAFFQSVAYRSLGDVESALAHASRAAALPVVGYLRATALGQRALCQVDRGHVDEAQQDGDQAFVLAAQENEYDLFVGYAELGAAVSALAAGDVALGKQRLLRAMQRIHLYALSFRQADQRKRYLARPFPNRQIITLASRWGVSNPNATTVPM